MNYKKAKLCVILLFSIILGSKAQEGAVCSGGTATGTGGSVSFSIGLPVYTSIYSSGGVITQGLQQTYQCFWCGVGVKGSDCINLNSSVYPNPTTDYINLNLGNYKIENLSYQLFDINDKLLETNTIEKSEVSVFMGNLAPATYFLSIMKNNAKIKTFQIIKKK